VPDGADFSDTDMVMSPFDISDRFGEANANDSHSCQQRYCESFLFLVCNISGASNRPTPPPAQLAAHDETVR
jgi:hypothetical protein